MPTDVFISYSSEDKATADAVCAALESQGTRCWMAPRDILPGKEWAGSIMDAIAHTRLMVVVFSAHANASKHVLREVELAVNRGLTVLPFRTEDILPTESMAYFLRMPHWLDAITPPLQTHIDKLGETVRLILSGRDGRVLPQHLQQPGVASKSGLKAIVADTPSIPPDRWNQSGDRGVIAKFWQRLLGG